MTRRERGIAIITALAAQGVADDRLTAHVRLGQQNGLDRDELTARPEKGDSKGHRQPQPQPRRHREGLVRVGEEAIAVENDAALDT
jgi:hypothetical protein